jgi:glycosyltransferase involved in cell wall biosynthesis
MAQASPAKIAVFYPAFLGGGAEAVGLWILEALKQNYELTLFTTSGVDFDSLNALYGTNLSADQVNVKSLFSRKVRYAINALIANFYPVRMILFHLLIRYLKANRDDYDLLMSAYNAVDFGKQGLQYIHWIKVLEAHSIYNRISNFSVEQMCKNLSVTNSYAVAELIRNTYDLDVSVVYPPVPVDITEIPWHDKENTFICSGRLTKEKEPHRIISILKRVRDRGFDIKLYLTGGGGGIYPVAYTRFIKRLVQENLAWITLYENLKYEDYIKVVSRCKYGIHFKAEPFGISIAEMVRSGAIPFVRRQGGQIEIVGKQNQALFFDSEDEAVEQIVQVLRHTDQQGKIRELLAQQKNLFSTHRFIADINQVVESYFTNSYQG